MEAQTQLNCLINRSALDSNSVNNKFKLNFDLTHLNPNCLLKKTLPFYGSRGNGLAIIRPTRLLGQKPNLNQIDIVLEWIYHRHLIHYII